MPFLLALANVMAWVREAIIIIFFNKSAVTSNDTASGLSSQVVELQSRLVSSTITCKLGVRSDLNDWHAISVLFCMIVVWASEERTVCQGIATSRGIATSGVPLCLVCADYSYIPQMLLGPQMVRQMISTRMNCITFITKPPPVRKGYKLGRRAPFPLSRHEPSIQPTDSDMLTAARPRQYKYRQY